MDYKLGIDEVESKPAWTSTLILPGIVLASAILFIFIIRIKRNPEPDSAPSPCPDPVIEVETPKKELHITVGMQKVIDTLSDNEKAIIKIMINSGGSATQADIRYETGLPRSSLSGIINALTRKKIIKKREYGRTNVIELSEWFLSENEPCRLSQI